MDKKPGPSPQKPEGKPGESKAPSSEYSFKDPLRILKKREKSPVRIPRTSCISIKHHVLRPIEGAVGFSCNVIGPPVAYNVTPRTKRKTAATPEGDSEQHETENDDSDSPPTCTRPPKKDVDYYESINNTIKESIKSFKSSPPSKSFWEKTGAVPKCLARTSGRTPPKGPLPPFRKQTPTKLGVKTKLFPDAPDPKPTASGSGELSKSLPSTSTELFPDSANLKLDVPKSKDPPKSLSSSETKLFPDMEDLKSDVSKSEELPSSLPSTSAESEMFPGVADSKPAVLKSEESAESSPTASTEYELFPDDADSKPDVLEPEEPPLSWPPTSTESPAYDLPKSRSDFKDDIDWAKYNCLDFQEYKRTVNSRQKAYENSINRILPTLVSSKKDVHRLSVKLERVRSEVCDREETLRTQNDKLKYLVGRTMATISKVEGELEKYRSEILAYTTLTTDGNMGIDMRLNRLMWMLCGMKAEEMKARMAASEDRKTASGDSSSSDFVIIGEEDIKKLKKKP